MDHTARLMTYLFRGFVTPFGEPAYSLITCHLAMSLYDPASYQHGNFFVTGIMES